MISSSDEFLSTPNTLVINLGDAADNEVSKEKVSKSLVIPESKNPSYGEFVIPARIVSELGNGSTEAGARRLYAMMDRVQHSRKKSIGKGKVAVNSKADKHLPA